MGLLLEDKLTVDFLFLLDWFNAIFFFKEAKDPEIGVDKPAE
jgi:hypothetical protein